MAFSNSSGKGLEKTVSRIYDDLCYTPVKTNVHISKMYGSKKIHAEIDIIYTYMMHEIYVECKYRKNRKVSLEEVAKFAAVLQMFDIPFHRSEIVTNNYFDERAKSYSLQTGIRLIDRDALEKLNLSRLDNRNIFKTVNASGKAYKSGGFSGFLEYAAERLLSVEDQIKNNS